METEMAMKAEIEDEENSSIQLTEGEKDSFLNNKMRECPLDHTTLFVPYYADEEDTSLADECSILLTQLGKFGK